MNGRHISSTISGTIRGTIAGTIPGMLLWCAVLLLGAAIAGCDGSPAAPVARPPQTTEENSGNWPPTGTYPFATVPEQESYLGTMVRHGSTIYVIGGEGTDWSGSRKMRAYDMISKSWSEKAPMAYPRYGLAAIEMGGSIYALGGRSETDNGSGYGRHLERYDIAGNTWTTLPDIPFSSVEISGWSHAALCDRRIYVSNVPPRSDPSERRFILYSTADGLDWLIHRSELPWLYEPVIVSNGRKVYILGRSANGDTARTLMYAYDPETQGFDSLTPPDYGYRGYLSACYCRDRKIYKINSTAGSANVMEIYGIATDSWTRVTIPYPMTNNAPFQPLVMNDTTGEVYFCALPFVRNGAHFNPATNAFTTR